MNTIFVVLLHEDNRVEKDFDCAQTDPKIDALIRSSLLAVFSFPNNL